MSKLITNLAMPLDSEIFRSNFENDYRQSNGLYLREYSGSDGIMNYTKNGKLKSFTIKPGVNNFLTKKYLLNHTTSGLCQTDIGLPFEKFGLGFRFNYKYIEDPQTTVLLDIDLMQSGHKLEAGKTYCLSLYFANRYNSNSTNCPNYTWACGGNLDDNGDLTYTIIASNVYPDLASSMPLYIKFSPTEDCYHLYYCPNITISNMDVHYTLYILGLTEGEQPSFFLPESLGYSPIVSTCDQELRVNYTIGRSSGNSNVVRESAMSLDAATIFRSLDTNIKKYKDIFTLDWHD